MLCIKLLAVIFWTEFRGYDLLVHVSVRAVGMQPLEFSIVAGCSRDLYKTDWALP